MTSPALMIASGAALTSGRRSARCGPENVPNNCEILAFNEAPGALLVEEGDDRRCILCDRDQEAQDDTSDPAPARSPRAATTQRRPAA